MEIQTKLILTSIVTFLLTANTAMALEQINSENGYDPAARNGRVESTSLPTASFRSHVGHELKFSGGSENDTGSVASIQEDTVHHGEVTDPTSIDYISKN